MLVGIWRKENPPTLLVDMQTGAATLENSMEFPEIVENRTAIQFSNCISKYLHEEYESTNSKGYMHPNVYSSIIYNSQIIETSQVSIN